MSNAPQSRMTARYLFVGITYQNTVRITDVFAGFEDQMTVDQDDIPF